MNLIGDCRYSGARLDGRKFSIIRNGDELQRIRECLPSGQSVIWDSSMPMTEFVLDVLKAERGCG